MPPIVSAQTQRSTLLYATQRGGQAYNALKSAPFHYASLFLQDDIAMAEIGSVKVSCMLTSTSSMHVDLA